MFETSFNATYNAQANKYLKLTAGIDGKYSNSRNYKTMNDLLGGNQWIDIDQFAERDFSNDADIIQNDLNNPNRVIKVGDVFGYDYDMNIFKASAFLQNEWNVRHFEAYYGAKLTYYTFQRDGNMRNGRAEALNETSYGKGKAYWFIDPSFKAGLTYKPNGHHRLSINGLAESRAPLANNAYISPRIKDTRIPNLQSEKVLSYDANYEFNYRRFRGKVSAFRTHFKDGSEISRYYDDGLKTFVNHVLTNVDKLHSGVEAAFTYKINGNFSVTAAGSYGEYKYTNNALGIISAENGSVDEIGRASCRERV